MTILHLGVIDYPYAGEPKGKLPKSKKGKQKPRGSSTGTQSTGDVAEILEAKYHIMETFYDLHEEEIADQFAESMAGALESLVMGAPPTIDPYGDATAAVEAKFHKFLESKEMNGTATPGVPTKASLKGVNRRLKVKKGSPRPSFIDTGLYESSFKAWIE